MRASRLAIAEPRPSDARATRSGSAKWVVASTIAAARVAGSSDLKIPEPTKTACAPSCITSEIRRLATLDEPELFTAAKHLQSPYDLVRRTAREGRLPVPLFCAGGIATPADASLVMQLGAQAVFVGSGIFKSEDPATRAAAIVEATTHFKDPERVAHASEGLGTAMQSLETRKLEAGQLLANRGW